MRKTLTTTVLLAIAFSFSNSVAQEILPQLSRLALSSPIYASKISGNYIYSVAGRAGLVIYNISDPDSPREIAWQPPVLPAGKLESINRNNHNVYCGGWGNYPAGLFSIYDDLEIAAPQLLAEIEVPGHVVDIAVQYGEDYIWLAMADSGLAVVDISDLAAPAIVARAYVNADIREIMIVGHTAYLAAHSDGLIKLDVTDPLNPVEVDRLETTQYFDYLSWGLGDFIVASEGDSGVAVVDITDSTLERISFYPLIQTGGVPRSVELFFDTMFLTAAGGKLLEVVDMSDPAQPILRGFYESPSGDSGLDVSAEYGNVAVSVGQQGFILFDVFSFEQPHLRARRGLFGSVQEIELYENYLYVLQPDRGMLVFDVSNPALPVQTATVPLGALDGVDITFRDSKAYVLDQNGVSVYDVTDPAVPQFLNFTFMDIVGFYSIAFHNDDLLVGSFYRLRQLALTDDDQVEFIADLSPTNQGSVSGIEVVGDYVFLSQSFPGGFEVFDFSDPLNPQSVVATSTTDWAHGIAITGNIAALCVDYAGLQLFDISNPLDPQSLSTTETSIFITNSVDAAGNYVVTGGQEGYVDLFDISDPAAPELIGRNPALLLGTHVLLSADARTVFAADDYDFYILDASGVVPVTDPARPAALPGSLELSAYPNPFNSSTTLRFVLPAQSRVQLELFDVQGRLVKTLADELFTAGMHTVQIDLTQQASGVYFSRLRSGGTVRTAKLLLLK